MIKFSAKEMLGTIAKQVAIAFAVQNGMDAGVMPIVGVRSKGL